MINNGNSNVGSKRTKHTHYARMTSLFRKLDNEIGDEKKRIKKYLREDKEEA